MVEENSVWILSYAVNDYNQHGEYFVAAFRTRPTSDQLMAAILESEFGYYLEYYDADYREEYANYILTVGGRRGVEDVWFNLRPWVFQ